MVSWLGVTPLREASPDLAAAAEPGSDRYKVALDCVHCGLCLSSCPTYEVTGQEAASPRGRIYLMRAFEEGEQADTAAFREHMESCLVCRACETACPSGVRFGSMMEEFRALYRGQLETQPHQQQRETGAWSSRLGLWLLRDVLPNRRRLRTLANLLWFLQRSGLTAVARRLGVLKLMKLAEAESVAPAVPSPRQRQAWPEVLAPFGEQRARVLFLRGCVTPEVLPSMQQASIAVLRHNGCEVVTPSAQTCCGALHFHAGQRQTGLELLEQNLEAFPLDGFDAIIVNAAGCGSTMKEYGHLAGAASPLQERASRFADKVRDISEFLCELGLLPPTRSVPLRVAYDAPCHLLHGQGIDEAPQTLLRQIPDLELVPLPDADRCCGSAGIYNVLHPQTAGTLGEWKARSIVDADVDVVASGNSGCILQIRGAIQKLAEAPLRGQSIQVVHPMELLQRAYD